MVSCWALAAAGRPTSSRAKQATCTVPWRMMNDLRKRPILRGGCPHGHIFAQWTVEESAQMTTQDKNRCATASEISSQAVALAEQLGRIAGTIEGKAEKWMDRA